MSSTLELDSDTVAKLQDLAKSKSLSIEDLLKAYVPGLAADLPEPKRSPEEILRALDEWIAELPDMPGLSDEAISRESIYSDR
jgi:hypothetical protein